MIAWDALKQHLLSTLGMRTATGALRSFKAAQLPLLALKALRERCRGLQRSRCSSISEVAVADLPSHLGNAFAMIRDPTRFAAPTAEALLLDRLWRNAQPVFEPSTGFKCAATASYTEWATPPRGARSCRNLRLP